MAFFEEKPNWIAQYPSRSIFLICVTTQGPAVTLVTAILKPSTNVWLLTPFEPRMVLIILVLEPFDSLRRLGPVNNKKGAFKDTNGNTQSDDDVYSLIMQRKEDLLSLDEPLRFIFSHSALREGWDNPNVFQICTLKEAGNSEIRRRQEIGRGLRLPYGEKTGNKNVDRVMIVAHDNYAKVIEEAQHSKLIQPSNIESISTNDTKIIKEVIEVQSVFVASIQEQIKASPAIMQEIEAQATKTVSAVISDDTPEDVKAETIQNKTDKMVEIMAKNEA